MSGGVHGQHVYIWCSGRVIRVDGGAHAPQGHSFSDLAGESPSRSAVVLIAHRASVIRQTKVPLLGDAQLVPLVMSKIPGLLPAGSQPYVANFRIAREIGAPTKIAIVGAAKETSLRAMFDEAKAANLKIASVVPAPFAAWLAAQSQGLHNVVVVSREASDLCIDIIADGELKYSRFCSLPSGPEEVLEEIFQTCSTAGVESREILCLNGIEVPGARNVRETVAAFAPELSKLMSLDLPEHRRAAENKKMRLSAQRALLTAFLAIGIWTYILVSRQAADAETAKRNGIRAAMARAENLKRKKAVDDAVKLKRTQHLIDLAFSPAQTFGDLISLIARDSDSSSWITGLSLEKGKPLTLRGQAKDGKVVSKFVSKLSNEPRLRQVKLLFSNKGQLHDTPVVQFSVSGVPIGNLPFDREVSLEKPKS